MNTTTLFDLNQTAAAAAVSALGKDALGTDAFKLEAFGAAGHDRADYAQWEQYFANHLRNYTGLKLTLSPAAIAAKQALPTPAAADAANRTAAAAATSPKS